ncbi:uncharacterized protein MONOS_8624 [Monocercomonoides exilis]|uniref:uncharacterized protein n=1 Tax=Monocercomonoides exilis TaxID=2049356 RepID=UPI00355A6536|nr:hypothetical protein MONOS_8624 [Monocercomonoides exilis]|eukprot:MONOS_8624.1-p1 / transcript=MONOS_8624.1 / gene=MONOS_8624 / organism=Monocercomonoides_exilis_PA203 / gene_product=unspecified product / transcript_product=unspecified product / location=Mono_scaffold00329:50437-51041(-) / protein_length=141 / sequence_SO=supercontig / SO=protein_coding / is_pseudo=false
MVEGVDVGEEDVEVVVLLSDHVHDKEEAVTEWKSKVESEGRTLERQLHCEKYSEKGVFWVVHVCYQILRSGETEMLQTNMSKKEEIANGEDVVAKRDVESCEEICNLGEAGGGDKGTVAFFMKGLCGSEEEKGAVGKGRG